MFLILYYLLSFAFLLFTLFILFYAVTFVIGTKTGSPYVPSTDEMVKNMIRLANVQKGDSVTDIGAGDGRVLIAAAKKGALAEGWEIDPIVWKKAQKNIKRNTLDDRVKVHFGSHWKHSLAKYNIIFVYQLTEKLPPLEEKIKKECRPGTKIIANTYPLKASKPKKIDKTNKMWLYRV